MELTRRKASDIEFCGTCDHARRTTNLNRDRVLPEPSEKAAVKAVALIDAGGIAEVSARVFRVAGDTDTYTVTIPLEDGLASLCNCMAAKVRPEEMCKHQSAVFLAIGKRERKVSA